MIRAVRRPGRGGRYAEVADPGGLAGALPAPAPGGGL